jgi:indolepyruvate ferredoxin oxidoreductase alpha subunit
MEREILLADEAIALGAVHAGLSCGYSYPGTPASEIMEYLLRLAERDKGFHAAWCVNEKVAYEEALGASFAGMRAMVSFKHVGLNVAADPFINSAITGANGGLVVVSADDPGMHSSQDEQDSRFYAQFALIPCLEPADHQEAYDMTRDAFDLSEKTGLPVMLRVVTRLAHCRGPVQPSARRGPNELRYGAWTDWTLLPVNARRRFKALTDLQPELVRGADASPWNRLELDPEGRALGVIAAGIGFNYLKESLEGSGLRVSWLKVGCYPLPEALVRRLVDHVETILVLEDGYPLIERSIKGLFGIPGKTVVGKLSGRLPLTGELTPETVRTALGLAPLPARAPSGLKPANRPPQLCQGCPHTDTFHALKKALEGYPRANVFSDIGCYTLGAYPPHSAVQTCVCMGASVTMAKGGAEAGVHPAVAVIGDSTFGHSGLTGLLDAALAGTPMTVFILDNATTAMTGGQPSGASGPGLLKIVEGLGVSKDHIRVIVPLPKNLDANARTIKEELDYPGLSVIIADRICVQETRKKT